jgi:hypothetical protein
MLIYTHISSYPYTLVYDSNKIPPCTTPRQTEFEAQVYKLKQKWKQPFILRGDF